MKDTAKNLIEQYGVVTCINIYNNPQDVSYEYYRNTFEDEDFWMPIKGFEEIYEVHYTGKIRNAKTQKVLKPHPANGYYLVGLYKDGKANQYYVHKLVAEVFVGLPTNINPDGTEMRTAPEINHKDNIPSNNDYRNIEWCDRYYNNQHRKPYSEWVHKEGKAHGRPRKQI